jgi:hypothetical protein
MASTPGQIEALDERQRRRDFLKGAATVGVSVAGVGVLGATASRPVEAEALLSQGSPGPGAPRIAILKGGYHQEKFDPPYMTKLARLGYIVEPHYANGSFSQLPSMANQIVQSNPNLIYTTDTPASQAARAATDTSPVSERIPVVMAVCGNILDPLVDLDPNVHPQLTGFSDHLNRETTGTRVCIIQQIVNNHLSAMGENPNNFLLGIIYNADNDGKAREMQETIDAAVGHGIPRANIFELAIEEPPPIFLPGGFSFSPFPGSIPPPTGVHVGGLAIPVEWNLTEVFNTIDNVRNLDPNRMIVVVAVEDPIVFQLRRRILDFLKARRIPSMWESVIPLTDEGLVCFGPDRLTAYLKAADIAHEIIAAGLRPGAPPPGNLPGIVELKSRAYYNPGAAAALGINIDPDAEYCREHLCPVQ